MGGVDGRATTHGEALGGGYDGSDGLVVRVTLGGVDGVEPRLNLIESFFSVKAFRFLSSLEKQKASTNKDTNCVILGAISFLVCIQSSLLEIHLVT